VVYDSDSLVLRTHNIFVENEFLYLASHTVSNDEYYPMSVLSLEDPANPVVVSRLIPPTIDGNPMFDHVHDVHVRNDTAYCSVGNSGLFVYDFSKDRANPVLISALTHYPQAGYNHSSWLNPEGDILVFVDETHGTELKAYDVSNPKSMKFLSTFGKNARDGSVVHNPYIKDSLVFTSYYHEGVVVFDMSDPENIKEVASYDTYPDNIQEDGSRTYSGYNGCWGVYPYLPSGNIIATDMTYGLFIFNLREIGTSVNEQAELKSRIKSYPNPFENYFKIEFNASKQKVVSFEVLDISGKSYQKQKVDLKTGKNLIRFEELETLPAGMYFVRVITPDISTSIKIIK
jgi:choice-of-anchor B domain-containing protein